MPRRNVVPRTDEFEDLEFEDLDDFDDPIDDEERRLERRFHARRSGAPRIVLRRSGAPSLARAHVLPWASNAERRLSSPLELAEWVEQIQLSSLLSKPAAELGWWLSPYGPQFLLREGTVRQCSFGQLLHLPRSLQRDYSHIVAARSARGRDRLARREQAAAEWTALWLASAGGVAGGALRPAAHPAYGIPMAASVRYPVAVSQRPEPWVIDPDDPRAPPQELWERMTDAQRQQVVDNLPSDFPPSEAHPPEGDQHTEAVYGARTALRRFFGKLGRSIYVGTNLPVYYPGRAMFSPDVMAVLDVSTEPRSSWIVSKEGKGLDLALEVIVLGSRRKDLQRNVEEYARLGIHEYFVFDRPRLQLSGYRLRASGQSYEPIVPQHGRYASEVLGLQLRVDAERLRFYVADAELPAADDLIVKLEGFVDDLEQRLAAAEERAAEEARRAEDEARRAEDEARRAEDESRRAEDESRRAEDESRRAEDEARRAREEARRADAAEMRLREALAELDRLKRERR